MQATGQAGYDPAYLDALLKEGDAAEFLGYSPRSLQKWRVVGGGPQYVRVSSRRSGIDGGS